MHTLRLFDREISIGQFLDCERIAAAGLTECRQRQASAADIIKRRESLPS